MLSLETRENVAMPNQNFEQQQPQLHVVSHQESLQYVLLLLLDPVLSIRAGGGGVRPPSSPRPRLPQLGWGERGRAGGGGGHPGETRGETM